MAYNRSLPLVFAGMISLVSWSCYESAPVDMDNPFENLDMTQYPALTEPIYVANPGELPYTIEALPTDDLDEVDGLEYVMPQGVHLRPGVELFKLVDGEIGDIVRDEVDPSIWIASGSAASALHMAGPQDAVFVGDQAFIIDDVIRANGDLVFETSPFAIAHVIWGSFRITHKLPWAEVDDPETEEIEGYEYPDLYEYETRSYAESGTLFDKSFDESKTRTVGRATLTFTAGGHFKVPSRTNGVFEARIYGVIREPDGWDCLDGSSYCVDLLQVYYETGLDLQLKGKFEAQASIEVSTTIYEWAGRTFSLRIGTTPLVTTLTPYIEIGASAKATGTVVAGKKWDFDARLPMGFQYAQNTHRRRGANLKPGLRDGPTPIPNMTIKPSVSNSGLVWDPKPTLDATLEADLTLEGGIQLGVGVDLWAGEVGITGAKIFGRLGPKLTYRPVQTQADPAPCLEAEAVVEFGAKPSIIFYAKALGKTVYEKNIGCDSSQEQCAEVTTGNILRWRFLNIPERYYYWKNEDVCLDSPFYNSVKVTAVGGGESPAGTNDPNGLEVDSVYLTKITVSGAPGGQVTSRIYYADQAKVNRRPDAMTCNDLTSKCDLITSNKSYTFAGKTIAPGDSISVVRPDPAGNCLISGRMTVCLNRGARERCLATDVAGSVNATYE